MLINHLGDYNHFNINNSQVPTKEKSVGRFKLGTLNNSGVFVQVKTKNISKTIQKMQTAHSSYTSEKKRYLLIHQEGNPVLLKMKSVINRLNLTEKDLQALEENPKEALTLLNKKADELNPAYPIKQQMTENKFNITISDAPLSDSALLKIVHIFSSLEQRTEKLQLNQKLESKPEPKSKPVKIFDKQTVDSFPFLSRLSKKNQLKLIWIGAELGSGTFSTVHEAFSDATGQVFALKQLKNNPEALIEVSNELNLLKMIHQNGPAWGIKENASKVIQIRNPDQSLQEGNLSIKYDSDFFSYIVNLQNNPNLKNDLPARLCEIHQLLSGLKQIHALGILHSDIKPENILVKKGADHQVQIHLADFGGARFISKDMSLDTITQLRTIRSHEYITKLDKHHLSVYSQRGMKDMFLSLEEQIDVFALGVTIYMLLTANMPFKFDRNMHPILTNNTNFSRDFKYLPSELLILVQNMLKEQASDRPSAAEVCNLFNNYLETKHPETHQLIQQWIKDGGYQPV